MSGPVHSNIRYSSAPRYYLHASGTRAGICAAAVDEGTYFWLIIGEIKPVALVVLELYLSLVISRYAIM